MPSGDENNGPGSLPLEGSGPGSFGGYGPPSGGGITPPGGPPGGPPVRGGTLIGGGGGPFGPAGFPGAGSGRAAQRLPYGSTNFTAGEMTPRLFGRTDLRKYYNGASIIENFQIMKIGGLIRRPGTKFVAEVKDSTKVTRVVPFQFSTTQTYQLEFGEYYIRFYRNDARLMQSFTVTNATNATPIVITTGANHNLITGQTVTITGVVGNTAANGTFLITRLSANTFSLKSSVGNGAYVSGGTGTAPTEIHTPYSEADLPDLKFNQSNDVLTICHPSLQARKLSRTSGTDSLPATWTLVGIAETDGPYLDLNTSATTLTPSATTGAITVTASAATFVASDAGTENISNATNATPIVITTTGDHGLVTGRVLTISGVGGNTAANGTWFVTVLSATTFSLDGSVGSGAYTSGGTTDVGNAGRLVRIGYIVGSDLRWGTVRITSFTSNLIVNGTVIDALNGTTASLYWYLGAWSIPTGYPCCSCFHKDRQWFGGTTSQPHRIDASRTTNFFSFTPTSATNDAVLATHALHYLIQDNKVNTVKWLLSHTRGLLILTDGGPFTLVSGDPQEPISATSFSLQRQGTLGCASRVTPRHVNGSVLFAEVARKRIYETAFRFAEDSYAFADMTLLAEHLTAPGVFTDLCYQEQPNSTFWAVRADGQLCAMTYERSEDVIGWHRHVIGGAFSSGQAVVEHISIIREGVNDELRMVVKRTINGSTKRYIEYLTPEFGLGDTLASAYQVDCGLSYSGAPATVFSGLSHLEGQVLDVFADGISVGPKTVSAGGFTLSVAASVVHAGLPYDSTLKTMPLVPQVQGIDVQGSLKRAIEMFLLLNNTSGGSIASGDGPLETLTSPYADENYNAVAGLFDGLRRWPVPSSSYFRSILTVKQTLPQPLTLLSISAYSDIA